jgi:hypothetical protein
MQSEDPEQPHYKTALVCVNGHLVTSNINDGRRAAHCTECGAETISTCPNCKQPIRGGYYIPWTPGSPYKLPKYCHACGRLYPWTEAKLQALKELISETEGLSADEKERLSGGLKDLIADTAKTETAVLRMKKAFPKMGHEIAGAVGKILVEVVSTAAKKGLGL